MNFELLKKENHCQIISHIEKLDRESAEELKQIFENLILQKERNAIIDLTKTRFCDSSGLNVLLFAHKAFKNAKGSFIICGLNTAVKKVITIAKLHQIFKLVPTISEAVDYLFMEEIERQLNQED